jgi:hypothetical protein
VVQAEPNEWEAAIRRSSSQRLADLDDFHAKAADETGPEWADTAATIIDDLLARGLRERHNAKKTVGLYCP